MSFQLIGVKWLKSQHTSQDHKLTLLRNPSLLWITKAEILLAFRLFGASSGNVYLLALTNPSNVKNIYPIDFSYKAKYSWREVCTVDVSTKQNKSLIQLNWSWRQKPPSFFHILPIRQSWLESSFVWLEQGGDYQWHLSSATYHRSGAVLAHMGPAEDMGTVGICPKQHCK